MIFFLIVEPEPENLISKQNLLKNVQMYQKKNFNCVCK